jgi:hypothetical protein
MNKDEFDDLKQFIEATVSQAEVSLDTELKVLLKEVRD